MPNINPSLVPLVNPGSVFAALTENNTLGVRWLTSLDPHFFDVYNRPMADITLRQLIIAKTVDQLGLRLSHQGLFPFLIPPRVVVGSSSVSVPVSWIWDMHVSFKDTWENLRLNKIMRISGDNPTDTTDGDATGVLRLVFTANAVGSTSETALFYVDYEIDSILSFQVKTVKPATLFEHSNPIPSGLVDTISGFVVFRTLDLDEEEDFFVALAPPTAGTEGSDGVFDTPTEYELENSDPGSSDITGDFSFPAVSHGTGIIVPSAYNVIPPIGADELAVLEALNYPWRQDTNLTSSDSKSTVPSGLFSQFVMNAPMGDRDTGELEENYPVFLTKIIRLDSTADELELVFSTHNTIDGSTSEDLIEFGKLILSRDDIGSGGPGTVKEISPLNNLRNNSDVAFNLFFQNFGSGYVILSTKWATDTLIVDFFDSFKGIIDDPAERFFSAQLNDFALHRTPSQVPTLGESQALVGSTARREAPIHPSDGNRYVTESDQGRGDEIDFREVDGIDENEDIDPIAYRGSLVARTFILKVNTANDAKFDYETDILPRIKHILGRDPIFNDVWFDGTSFKRFTGDVWIG